MKKNNDFEDKILDDLLADAMDDLYPDFQDLSTEDEIEPSKEFQDSMEKMFREEKNRLRGKLFRHRIPRIAAVFALFLVLAFITINTTSAWKEPLYNFFFRNSEDMDKTKVEIAEDEEVDMDQYLPEYVPEGFELVEKNYIEETTQYSIHYEKNNLYIVILIVTNKEDLYVDLSSFTKIERNGIIYYKNNKDIIIWNYKNYYFFLTSNLNQSEMLKIADSIQ